MINNFKAPFKLKECPWCKNEPEVVQIILDGISNGYFVACNNLKCKVQPKSRIFYDIIYEDKNPSFHIKRACEAWNSD